MNYTVTMTTSYVVEAESPEQAIAEAKWLFDCGDENNPEWKVEA